MRYIFSQMVRYIEGIEVSFTITSPHWFKKDPTVEYISGISGDFSKVISNVGTYKSEPKIIIACK